MANLFDAVCQKHVWVIHHRKCYSYDAAGVCEVAKELRTSFAAAEELVKDWINRTMY